MTRLRSTAPAAATAVLGLLAGLAAHLDLTGAVIAALAVVMTGAGAIVWIRTDSEFTTRGHRIEDATYAIESLGLQVIALERDGIWLRGQLRSLGREVGPPPAVRRAVDLTTPGPRPYTEDPERAL